MSEVIHANGFIIFVSGGRYEIMFTRCLFETKVRLSGAGYLTEFRDNTERHLELFKMVNKNPICISVGELVKQACGSGLEEVAEGGR